MKYDGVVILSDLDGTLLDDDRRLSQENYDAVAEFVSQGGKFGVATGRMERTTLHKFPDLAINIPSIFINGAIIYDIHKEEDLLCTYMPMGLQPMMADLVSRYPQACCEVNVRGKAYIFNPNDIVRLQLQREGLEAVEAKWDDVPKEWTKVIFLSDRETLVKIRAELESRDRDDLNIMYSEVELLDIVAKNVNKGVALNYLKQRYKDEWRFVVTIGDNDNDIELVKEADLGIAVANARPQVKKVAKHIIKSNEYPCILQVLEILEQYLPNI